MKFAWPIPWLFAVISGCSSWTPDYHGQDSGYRVVLHEPLIVAPGNARVFLQFGQMLPSLSFDQYETSCSLELRTVSEQPQRIEVDEFIVTRVQQMTDEVAAWRSVRIASLSIAGMGFYSDASDIFRGWHFWLYSQKQPDVLRMTCRGEFAEPWDARPPTLEEIGQALGGKMTLKTRAGSIVPGSY